MLPFLAALTLAAPPVAPKGLPQCAKQLSPVIGTEPAVGASFAYTVELLGIDLGTVTVATVRRARFEGRPVTEYRATIEGEPIVRRMLGVDGELAALVPEGAFTPVLSRLEYSYRSDTYVETQRHFEGGRVTATRTKNGKRKSFERDFGTPVLDILTAFNLVSRLPAAASGCVLMYTDGRAFTVWIEPAGKEKIELDGRRFESERYLVRYGSDKAQRIHTLDLWVSADRRLLRAESHAKLAPTFSLRRG